MKQLFKLLVLGLMSGIFFVSCGGGDNGSENSGGLDSPGNIGGGSDVTPKWYSVAIPDAPNVTGSLFPDSFYNAKGLDINGKLTYVIGRTIMRFDYNTNQTTFQTIEKIPNSNIRVISPSGVSTLEAALGSSYDSSIDYSALFSFHDSAWSTISSLDNNGNGVWISDLSEVGILVGIEDEYRQYSMMVIQQDGTINLYIISTPYNWSNDEYTYNPPFVISTYPSGHLVLHKDGKLYAFGFSSTTNDSETCEHNRNLLMTVYSFDTNNDYAMEIKKVLFSCETRSLETKFGLVSVGDYIYASSAPNWKFTFRYNPQTNTAERNYQTAIVKNDYDRYGTYGFAQPTADIHGNIVYTPPIDEVIYGNIVPKNIGGVTPVAIPVISGSIEDLWGEVYNNMNMIPAHDGKIYSFGWSYDAHYQSDNGFLLTVSDDTAKVEMVNYTLMRTYDNGTGDVTEPFTFNYKASNAGTLTQSGKIVWIGDVAQLFNALDDTGNISDTYTYIDRVPSFIVFDLGPIPEGSPFIQPRAGEIADSQYNGLVNHY